MKLSDLNPFALPTVRTLVAEEIAELERLLYLADKLADHHRAQATALHQRLDKLRSVRSAAPDLAAMDFDPRN